MKQREADSLAIELLNLEESFGTSGVDRTVVVAHAAKSCVERIRILHPMISASMDELEILRAKDSA